MSHVSALYIGIMSGTSVDAIDIAVVEIINNEQCNLVATLAMSFTSSLREDIIHLCETQQTSLFDLGQLSNRLSHAYAEAVNLCLKQNNIAASTIVAIGCHGQTVCHSPNSEHPFSMQLLNPNILAAETQIDVVSDFRGMDLAVGGQGAPLIPLFHQFLFKDQNDSHQQPKVLLNIGGIANISMLNPGPLIGFDTGPGNILLDAAAAHYYQLKFDHGGQIATSGKCDPTLLNEFLSDPYFTRPYPKSTGREHFNLAWLLSAVNRVEAQLPSPLAPKNIMTTLCHLTAKTIADAIKAVDPTLTSGGLFVFGGGSHNQYLMAQLQKLMPNWAINSTDKIAINTDYMEAMAFAWLAYQRVNQRPGNSPLVTGAKHSVICGQMTKATVI